MPPLIDVDPLILGTTDPDEVAAILLETAANMNLPVDENTVAAVAQFLAAQNRTVEDVSDYLSNSAEGFTTLAVVLIAFAGGGGSSVRPVNAMVTFDVGGAYDNALPIPEGFVALLLEQPDPSKNGVYTFDQPGEDEGTFSATIEPLSTSTIYTSNYLTTTDGDPQHPQEGDFLAIPVRDVNSAETVKVYEPNPTDTIHGAGQFDYTKVGSRVFFSNGGGGMGYFQDDIPEGGTGLDYPTIQVGTLDAGYRPETFGRAFQIDVPVNGGSLQYMRCDLTIGTDGVVRLAALDDYFNDSRLTGYRLKVEGLNFSTKSP